MKKMICLITAVLMVLVLTACGGGKPAESSQPANTPEASASPAAAETDKSSESPAAAADWTREGYFVDEDGNMLSVTWMDDVDEPGWYVACMLGEDLVEDSYGGMLKQEGVALRGKLVGEAGELTVAVSEENGDGIKLEVEGGSTYHLKPYDMPEAVGVVTINTDGAGQVGYIEEGQGQTDVDEYYTSIQFGLEEPASYILAAKETDQGWYFVKWTKNGTDFSTERQIKVELSEDADFIAVFDFDQYIGTYVDGQYGEPGLEITRNDDGTYGVKLTIIRLTSLDDGVGRMEPDGLHFTATDANGNPISGVITIFGAEADVTFTDSSWSLLENGTSFKYYMSDFVPAGEDGQNPVMNFIGDYVCDRASALVEAIGAEEAKITITWSSSAAETAEWVMSGHFDENTLTVEYSDCVMTVRTYNSDGEAESENVEFENGTGRVVFSGESLAFTWDDDQSDREEPLEFEWLG